MSELINKPYFKGLNNNQLKIIAMITMLIDHIGVAFFPSIKILRCIGRIAFPIYAYMIAEGCRYTKNSKKYLAMIAGMAFIFQIVYFVFMNSLYQGILVTFSLSIGAIFAIDTFIKNKNIVNRILMAIIILFIFTVSTVFPVIFKAYGFKLDYGMWGLCFPILVYFAPSKIWRIILSAIFLIFMSLSTNVLQWWSLLTIPLFMLYNGERGSKKLKYVFYLFYPIHLVIIYAIMFLLTIIKNFK